MDGGVEIEGEVEDVWREEEEKCDAIRSARDGVFPAFEGERMSSGGGRTLNERERRALVVEGPIEKKRRVAQVEEWDKAEREKKRRRRKEERR